MEGGAGVLPRVHACHPRRPLPPAAHSRHTGATKPGPETAMPSPIPLAPKTRNPLPRLERLPAWWLGKAETRRMLARDARERRLDELAEQHLRTAIEYERHATSLVIT
jgi:hypothetical protein